MGAVFIIVQVLFATRRILKIGQNHSDIPQFQQGHVRSRWGSRINAFDQSSVSENISWITNFNLECNFQVYRLKGRFFLFSSSDSKTVQKAIAIVNDRCRKLLAT